MGRRARQVEKKLGLLQQAVFELKPDDTFLPQAIDGFRVSFLYFGGYSPDFAIR